jgi:hypothetical protein
MKRVLRQIWWVLALIVIAWFLLYVVVPKLNP